MKDPAKGVGTESMLNSILSECIWGVADLSETASRSYRDWTILSTNPSATAPTSGNNMFTYGNFLESEVMGDTFFL